MKVFVVTAVAVLLLVLALWRPWEADKVAPIVEGHPQKAAQSAPIPDSAPLPVAPDPGIPAVTPPVPPKLSPEDAQKVSDAIDNLEFTLRDFGAALGGNPVGNNAEITAALLGDNAKQVKFDLPGGSTLNATGELCDPWGTPWFFHQLSSSKTELRSAGPDRAMYTDDDFVR